MSLINMAALLTKDNVAEMGRIGRLRAPREACGVLISPPHRGQSVWEMPNRSTGVGEFVLRGSDIVVTLDDWLRTTPTTGIAIWHTHPSGRADPSVEDMAVRRAPQMADFAFLILALREDGADRPNWY